MARFLPPQQAAAAGDEASEISGMDLMSEMSFGEDLSDDEDQPSIGGSVQLGKGQATVRAQPKPESVEPPRSASASRRMANLEEKLSHHEEMNVDLRERNTGLLAEVLTHRTQAQELQARLDAAEASLARHQGLLHEMEALTGSNPHQTRSDRLDWLQDRVAEATEAATRAAKEAAVAQAAKIQAEDEAAATAARVQLEHGGLVEQLREVGPGGGVVDLERRTPQPHIA